MLLNQELFGIVSLTASGLLMEASVTLGMKFKPSELASLVISNDRDDREEINKAIVTMLQDSNIKNTW